MGDDARHIAVLRMDVGDELVVSDGAGNDYLVRIEQVGKSEIRATVVNRSTQAIRSPRIVLGQGIAKSDKMDWIVQKATELGVATVVPLVTERTIVKIRDEEKKLVRWQKIAREAAMQSNRPDVPLVEPVVQLKDFLRTLNPAPGTLQLIPWEEGTEPIKNLLSQNETAKDVVVLIGPEGGFSHAEADLAKSSGFHPVSLGKNILRTETASLSVLSMIAYAYS
jgi:16S rRNA (uracil1498-N3)-methyltransferase